MTSYNVTIELAERVDVALSSKLVDELEDYHPAAGRGPTGHQDVTITVQAEDLRQATTTALALVQSVGGQAWSLHALLTEEFDRRLGLNPIPELLSVTQVAERLHISRAAVQQRIDAGTLPAQRIGKAWVIPATAVKV